MTDTRDQEALAPRATDRLGTVIGFAPRYPEHGIETIRPPERGAG